MILGHVGYLFVDLTARTITILGIYDTQLTTASFTLALALAGWRPMLQAETLGSQRIAVLGTRPKLLRQKPRETERSSPKRVYSVRHAERMRVHDKYSPNRDCSG